MAPARRPSSAPLAERPASRPARWRELFAGASPREVLERLSAGDPLRLRERISRRLDQRHLLLDADRVQLRVLARVARSALEYRGRPVLPTWLQGLVDQTLDELCDEDLERALRGEPDGDVPATLRDLARPLGLEPAEAWAGCARFNAAADAERRDFFELVLAGRSLDELARSTGRPVPHIARNARRALRAFTRTPATTDDPVETEEMP